MHIDADVRDCPIADSGHFADTRQCYRGSERTQRMVMRSRHELEQQEHAMQSIGMVGLGRMGGNMGRRIARGGLGVVAWDRAAGARAGLAAEAGVTVVETLDGLVQALKPPRVVWLMLPAVTSVRPSIIRMVVVLPAPFGPSSPKISPRATVNEMSSTAAMRP